MAISIPSSFTQRSYTWTNWKTVLTAKNGVHQYDNDSVVYTVYFYDGPEVHLATIWQGTVPPGIVAGGYSQAQNDSDKTDFVTNYLPTANAAISPESKTGSGIPNSASLLGASDGSTLQPLQVESSTAKNLRTSIYRGTTEVNVRSDNRLSVFEEQAALLYETFDGTGDPVNIALTWDVINTSVGGVASAMKFGSINPQSWGRCVSKQSGFETEGGTLTFMWNAKFESGSTNLANIWRFLGYGTFKTTPAQGTAGIVTDGIGFELAASGGIQAVVYRGSATSTAVTLTRPTDGYYHTYAIELRESDIRWFIDDMMNPVYSILLTTGTTSVTNNVLYSGFNAGFAQAAPTSPAVSGAVYEVGYMAVLINPARAMVLSDPVYGFRRARIDASGNLKVSEGNLYYGHNQRLRIGQETLLFSDSVDGSAVNTNLWTSSTVNNVIAVSNGVINMNNTSLNAANNYSILTSNKQVRLTNDGAVELMAKVKIAVSGGAAFMDIGFGAPSALTGPNDGIYLRASGGTAYSLNTSFNSTGMQLASNICVDPTTGTNLLASINNQWITVALTRKPESIRCRVWDYTNTLQYDTECPLTNGNNPGPQMPSHLPVYFRVAQSGVVGAACNIQIASISVTQLDLGLNKPWAEVSSSLQRSFAYKPDTFAQAPNYPLSAVPGNSALSASTPSLTTLGGIAAITLTAGAETDFPVVSYQVPSGNSFVLTGIKIEGVVTTALTTTASVFVWGIGINGTANVLTSGSPIRIPIGVQGLLASAAAGTATSNPIDHTFKTPLVIESGRWLHIILKIAVGSATGVVRYNIMPEGYFE